MRFKIRSFAPELAALALLIGLPLVGILAGALPLARYLEFPPRTHYIEHAGFAWPVFIGMAVVILAAVVPFVIRILFSRRLTAIEPAGGEHLLISALAPLPSSQRRFPAWGWIGILFGVIAWILAWTRFPWFAALQPYTFSPLWLAYIITVNALTWRRTGQCMLTHRTRYFLLLFPVSALFWWLFEYLNRFVQNWYYVGIGALTPLDYFFYATLPFATVLPAVMGTCDLLATYPRLYAGLIRFRPLVKVHSRPVAVLVFALSALGLAGIGLWPDYLFPLLWLAPLGMLASLQTLAGRTTLFGNLARGDWRRIVLLALSALICGFFWEMWNFYSLAKWVYAVPFVNRFHLFEMPILGYAGYLPFGLECALIADSLCRRRMIEETP
ncbi:MAG: hypothetical protein PHW60_09655 [Kiritimatiellae bacterium]|nr:hypothetical protein [Kiritimatiellia bacterium]